MRTATIRREQDYDTLTIANGNDTSNTISIAGYTKLGLVVPAELTSTDLFFEVSYGPPGSTFRALYTTGNAEVTMSVAAGRSYDLPAEFVGWRYFRIITGSTELAERTFYLVKKG